MRRSQNKVSLWLCSGKKLFQRKVKKAKMPRKKMTQRRESKSKVENLGFSDTNSTAEEKDTNSKKVKQEDMGSPKASLRTKGPPSPALSKKVALDVKRSKAVEMLTQRLAEKQEEGIYLVLPKR